MLNFAVKLKFHYLSPAAHYFDEFKDKQYIKLYVSTTIILITSVSVLQLYEFKFEGFNLITSSH